MKGSLVRLDFFWQDEAELKPLHPLKSDPSNQFWTGLQRHLYPGTPYSYVYGGDPKNITDLTYEALIQFHADHYHPSNSRFFTYGKISRVSSSIFSNLILFSTGDFPLADHLHFISEKISKFAPLDPKSLPKVKPISGMVRATSTFPKDPCKIYETEKRIMCVLTRKLSFPF